MSTTGGIWRVDLAGLVLHSAGTALGVLCAVLFTATAASAQTADLAITDIVDSPDPVAAGSTTFYLVTVINNGPAPAANVVVTNAPPPNTRRFGVTCGGGWQHVVVGSFSRGVDTCSRASMAVGETVTHLFIVSFNADVPNGTVITDTATVTSPTVDPNVGNNAAIETTIVNSGSSPVTVADVVVTNTGPAGPIPAAQNLVYAITVTNNGPSPAASAALSATTPPDTTFTSMVQNSGPAFACTTPLAGGVGAISCQLASLAASASATFTMTVQINAGTANGTTITNLAEFASDTTDTTLANNRATVTTLVGPLPTNTPTPTATATPTPTPTVTPTATPTRLPGDFNGDGFVDIRDYGVWRQNFGQTNCGNPADADGNCLVDIRDYGIWRLHFGEGTPPDRRGSGPLPAGIASAARSTPGPALVAGDPATEASGRLLRAEGLGPALPVLPVVGGLLGLGGLAGWQRRRPPGR